MTNMKMFCKKQKKPKVGDVFTLQILDDKFHWGRVVSLTANVGGFEDCVLIYIYKTQTESDTDAPDLNVSDLLVPPIATNYLPWKKGYFKTIKNCELMDEDLLPVHCFKSDFFDCCFDDQGNKLDKVYEPCGVNGLGSYASIDDDISDALGLELAPE